MVTGQSDLVLERQTSADHDTHRLVCTTVRRLWRVLRHRPCSPPSTSQPYNLACVNRTSAKTYTYKLHIRTYIYSTISLMLMVIYVRIYGPEVCTCAHTHTCINQPSGQR